MCAAAASRTKTSHRRGRSALLGLQCSFDIQALVFPCWSEYIRTLHLFIIIIFVNAVERIYPQRCWLVGTALWALKRGPTKKRSGRRNKSGKHVRGALARKLVSKDTIVPIVSARSAEMVNENVREEATPAEHWSCSSGLGLRRGVWFNVDASKTACFPSQPF